MTTMPATPEAPEQALDPERQRQAKIYARTGRRLLVVDLLLGAAYVAAWLAFGWSAALRAALQALVASDWVLVPAFAAVFGAGYFALDLPLSYYSGFVLPHRFGQSTQTLPGWVADQAKNLTLSAAMGVALLETIYALLRAAPDTWWLWVGGILLLFSVVLANLAPVLIMPLFYRFVPLGAEHADLEGRLTRLAERAGTRVRGVFQYDMSRRSKAANAALTGLGNTRRIILADTLLDRFTPDEVETVLAHELGHQVHRDVPVGIAVQAVLTLGGLFLASLGLRWGAGALGFHGVGDIAGLPLLLLVMSAYGLVTLPLGNGYSRWRERRADEYALRATGMGDAYAAALTRLTNQNLSDADPEPWVEWLLYSHPAPRRRIAMAQAASRARPG